MRPGPAVFAISSVAALVVLAPGAVAAQGNTRSPERTAARSFDLGPDIRARIENGRRSMPVNTIVSVVVRLHDRAGKEILGARIGVEGRALEIDRPLPTAARMGRELGRGRYRIDGLKFDTAGPWQIALDIAKDKMRATITFTVQADWNVPMRASGAGTVKDTGN